MKRTLLTLIAGLCFGGVALAQEPAKAAKKKSAATLVSSRAADVEKRDKAKIARAKAAEAAKTSASSGKAAESKKSLKADAAN